MRNVRTRVPLWGRSLFLLVFFVLSTRSEAEPVRQVTWQEIARAVDQHPRLAAARSQLEAARGSIISAGALPNPEAEATLGHGRARSGDTTRLEWGLNLNLPLSWIAQRGPKIAVAGADVALASADAKVLRHEVLLELRTLFWNLARDQALVAAMDALAEQSASLVAVVEKRVKKGESRPVEAVRVGIEFEKIDIERTSVRLALAARQATLALWLGANPGTTIQVVGDLDALPDVPDRDTVLAKVQASHPAILGSKARIQALDASLISEGRARVPRMALTGFTNHELDRRAYGLGMAIEVPAWNWNRGGIAQATAKLAASRKEAEDTTLRLAALVIDIQSTCQASVQTANRFRVSLVPAAESAAATMERTYQLGEASLLEVIDARRTILEARRLSLDALARAQIDCSRLAVITGEDFQ